jgi:hypothetical protein
LSGKNEDFFGIPLHTEILGKEFVKKGMIVEPKLQEKFNSLSLLATIIDNKFDIYLSKEHNLVDPGSLVSLMKNVYLEYHKIAALMNLFFEDEFKQILAARNVGNLEQVKQFLDSGLAEKIGIITGTTDGKPHFTYQCFARYLVVEWFTDNVKKC